MEGTQAKREHKAHNVAHSSLYIWVNLFCFLQFNIVICLLIILFEKKPKNCKAPQFCIYHCLYFRSFFFVCQRRFLQCLQWVLMGFSVCSTGFLVGSDGFLLWLSRKRNTPTFMKNTATEQVI